MNAIDGLTRLEAAVRADLERIGWPSASWVKPRAGPDGRPMADVIVVGAGQGGLTLGFQLMRERVERVAILDRAPPEGRGPWRTYGRMATLRSPKQATGPDLDVPSLTFRSWFEAQRGRAAWEGLGKIPKELWSDYLGWFERVLGLPVEAGVTVRAIRPEPDGVAVEIEGGPTRWARHVVLATGIESPGRWWTPEPLASLPARLVSHTAEPIDFAALRGRAVAVIGAGASAFDNAAAALEAGAAAVTVLFRRPELQRVQPYKQLSYAGFLRHMGDLDDATRWRFLRHLMTVREAFPAETHARVVRWPNARLVGGAAVLAARETADGRVALDTAAGRFVVDRVICGTGFVVDLAASPLTAPFAGRALTWADRLAEAAAEPRLGAFPWLGPSFELVARDPADATALSRVRLFTFAATMSFGPSGSSINALKFAAPRLVAGITAALFREDAEAHLADLLAYDAPEF